MGAFKMASNMDCGGLQNGFKYGLYLGLSKWLQIWIVGAFKMTLNMDCTSATKHATAGATPQTPGALIPTSHMPPDWGSWPWLNGT